MTAGGTKNKLNEEDLESIMAAVSRLSPDALRELLEFVRSIDEPPAHVA